MRPDPLQHIDIICYINLSDREDRKKNILLPLNRLDIPKQKVIHIEAVQDLMNALCDYFFSTLGNNWDVFMLGGRVKKYEQTAFNAIYRVLLADCAHAYCVLQNYIPKMVSSFKTSLELMKNDLFSYQSLPYAIDTRWIEL